MGKKKTVLLVGAVFISMVLSYSCASQPNESSIDPKSFGQSVEKSTGTEKDERASSQTKSSPEASDNEGRDAVNQVLGKDNAGFHNINRGPLHSDSKFQTPLQSDGSSVEFPINQEPETLQKLLLENDKMDLETHKTCLGEISALTVNAKNPEALEKLTESVVLIIKDKFNQSHWCFFAIHHQLNRDIISSGMTMDRKMDYFQKTMIDLVALAKGLDQLSKGQRYISYNRERYITHFREQFGRTLGRVEGEKR